MKDGRGVDQRGEGHRDERQLDEARPVVVATAGEWQQQDEQWRWSGDETWRRARSGMRQVPSVAVSGNDAGRGQVRLQHAPGVDQDGGQVVWGWVGRAQQTFTVGTLGRGPVINGSCLLTSHPRVGGQPRGT